ncbi:MAG: mercuric transport protein MerTP [Flavobacteriaceae bacterium]|nr:mercuric transport protein MerTP [Flavobacteriaceae bacterium]MDZ4147036.1 mercuric transport protein MerTP [Flavobacteriaceae bacterium]
MNKSSNSATEKAGKVAGAGLLVAVSASLCCITPVLALVSGTSGIASTFSWMEPFRPYLIAITVLVLGFAWYQKLKPRTADEIACACEDDNLSAGKAGKKPFMQTKTFLGIVTVFAALMLAFPNYSQIFYPKTEKQVMVVSSNDVKEVKFNVSGMTCTGCAEHIDHEVNKLEGVVSSKASYENGDVFVQFDSSKTSIEEIEKTINATGYTVVNHN